MSKGYVKVWWCIIMTQYIKFIILSYFLPKQWTLLHTTKVKKSTTVIEFCQNYSLTRRVTGRTGNPRICIGYMQPCSKCSFLHCSADASFDCRILVRHLLSHCMHPVYRFLSNYHLFQHVLDLIFDVNFFTHETLWNQLWLHAETNLTQIVVRSGFYHVS